MKISNDQELLADYGEVMLGAHLMEDVVKIHVKECAFNKVNGYDKDPERIKDLNAKVLIDELSSIYKNQRNISMMIQNLHRLRRIRNLLIHAFVREIGGDLAKELGKEQIRAMIKKITKFQQAYLACLQRHHQEMVKEAFKKNWMNYMKCEYEEFSSHVSSSEIQKLLLEIESSFEPK